MLIKMLLYKDRLLPQVPKKISICTMFALSKVKPLITCGSWMEEGRAQWTGANSMRMMTASARKH